MILLDLSNEINDDNVAVPHKNKTSFKITHFLSHNNVTKIKIVSKRHEPVNFKQLLSPYNKVQRIQRGLSSLWWFTMFLLGTFM